MQMIKGQWFEKTRLPMVEVQISELMSLVISWKTDQNGIPRISPGLDIG